MVLIVTKMALSKIRRLNPRRVHWLYTSEMIRLIVLYGSLMWSRITVMLSWSKRNSNRLHVSASQEQSEVRLLQPWKPFWTSNHFMQPLKRKQEWGSTDCSKIEIGKWTQNNKSTIPYLEWEATRCFQKLTLVNQ